MQTTRSREPLGKRAGEPGWSRRQKIQKPKDSESDNNFKFKLNLKTH